MFEIKKFDDRVVLEEKTTPYNGFFQVDRYKLKYQKHEGGWSSVVVRELFERGHTVAVLPYDPVQDKVVLIEQFRIGAYAAGLEPWLSETIAGIIDSGEGAEEVAHREALEEANCRMLELVKIGTFVMSPGGSSETTTMFCGRVDSGGVGGVYGLAQEGEDILARVVSLDEALKNLAVGKIVSAYAVIPLLWLQSNKASLKAQWT
ncbi:MAG: ADP-ribose diphosphatase [Magnetovibrio sp.]|nr:ADP-ribose diphosphatase [Magnetovibrio sp.]|tara:strand:- start:275 stop:889 length:615 start_codon:yes stop_codon:yes gene_type:complete